MTDLPDGTSVLLIFNQYAYHANCSTIHSKIQLQDDGNLVDDCPIKLGGTQRIVTPCGITMPLDVIRGLASLKLWHPTDDELATLEPVHMTKDKVWDPSKYDSAPSADADWFAALAETLLWNWLMVQLVRLHGTTISSSIRSYWGTTTTSLCLVLNRPSSCVTTRIIASLLPWHALGNCSST